MLEMLEQFEEHWDWQVLSRSKCLTFSMKLLYQFRHRWEWPIHKIHDQAAPIWPVDLPGNGFNPEKFPGFFQPDRSNIYRIRKPLNLDVLSAAVQDDMAWSMVNRLQTTKIAWSFELYKYFEDKSLLDLMTVPRHIFNIKWSPELIHFLLRQSSDD